MSAIAADAGLARELRDILGGEAGAVLTGLSARVNRARVPAPFPVHRWGDYLPDVVVLPRTAEQVSEILKLANRRRIPVVPRAGGTGLADGAVPLRGGIVVDVKRMDAIKDIDLDDLTVTVGPGINLQTLNRALSPHGVLHPDDPASYSCCLVGGRIGTSGWSLLHGRFGHARDLVISFEIVLPTGEMVTVGDGGARKIRKSSVGYQLKHLLMGHQGTLGIVTEATLEIIPKPEAQFAGFFVFDDVDLAYRAMRNVARSGLSTLAGMVWMDPEKVNFLRRDDETYIGMPAWVRGVCGIALYGSQCEIRPAIQAVMTIARGAGGRYLGDELSSADWAGRHDRYANPLHGRIGGQVAALSWHCEDAGVPASQMLAVRAKWHAVANRYVDKYGIFDNWGMFAYTNAAYKPWADVLVQIDIGIWEQRLDEEGWQAFVNLKRELAQIVIDHGGTLSVAHGGTRPGDAELVPAEMGSAWPLMKRIKRLLDPNNIMNPGKQKLDEAYEGNQ